MSNSRIDARERLIVALDLPGIAEAESMVRKLEGAVTFFKVGLSLQLAPGVEALIHALLAEKKKVFLDYKYYDIEETLKKAVSRAADLGVTFLTVHGSSGLIRSAVKGKGNSSLKLFTVTVLTSLDTDDMVEMGYSKHTVQELVMFRAQKALEAGCDGVIASGLEAKRIKEISQDKLLVVTPGIRQEGHPGDEQKRRTTPTQAIQAGADYLVVGRPITGAADPEREALVYLREMQDAFDSRNTSVSAA